MARCWVETTLACLVPLLDRPLLLCVHHLQQDAVIAKSHLGHDCTTVTCLIRVQKWKVQLATPKQERLIHKTCQETYI